MTNVNKVKLLSERTSGVPTVIFTYMSLHISLVCNGFSLILACQIRSKNTFLNKMLQINWWGVKLGLELSGSRFLWPKIYSAIAPSSSLQVYSYRNVLGIFTKLKFMSYYETNSKLIKLCCNTL